MKATMRATRAATVAVSSWETTRSRPCCMCFKCTLSPYKQRALLWPLRCPAGAVIVLERPGEDGPEVLLHRLVDEALGHAGVDELRAEGAAEVIWPCLEGFAKPGSVRILVNHAGSFVKGGPAADTGLTGRKIIVDTYGGSCPHGGGAFSGKDATKVDRSAAYAARWVARHIVDASLALRATVQLAYAIGSLEPVSVYVTTHGTGAVQDARLARAVQEVFDLSPAGIIGALELRRPVFAETAAYGHFGREGEAFTWEQTPHLESLQAAVGMAGARVESDGGSQ